MVPVEYVRSLNCNYERIHLEKKPEEKRYQYCILSRGGIKGLLACDLRYINGNAYLYYDISSKQNVEQLYCDRYIDREWVQDFLWSVKQIGQELERYLLDVGNVLWFPNQIFQDLETKMFSFLYLPYNEEKSSFGELLEFLTEHINYEDEVLVECVYHMCEQYEQYGEDYLQSMIFEDAGVLENEEVLSDASAKETATQKSLVSKGVDLGAAVSASSVTVQFPSLAASSNAANGQEGEAENSAESAPEEKRGFLGFFEGKRNRSKKLREEYKQSVKQAMVGYAVAEETVYESSPIREDEEEEYGRTVFIEEKEVAEPRMHRLLSVDGKLLATLDRTSLSIGKKKEEVDLALEDASVSRLHARVTVERNIAYLEDLNSTNGTFKNGLRLQPYEKRKLDEGDEIKCGKVMIIFR